LNEIMWTRMPCSAPSARAMVVLSPPSPAPTTATTARCRSMDTSPNARSSTNSASRRDGSSTVTDTETSDVATTSTDVWWRSNTSNSVRRNPGASNIREELTLITVTFPLPAIALTARRGASAVMRVPRPSGRRELKMNTGMPRCTAGAIVLGCSTLAPNVASSAASSKRISSMRRAPDTTRGSAVSMPSTSVQISMASAPNAAPRSAALKSPPPRPMVVVTPAGERPMNPPTTGTRPCATMGAITPRALRDRVQVRHRAGVQFVGDHHVARVDELDREIVAPECRVYERGREQLAVGRDGVETPGGEVAQHGQRFRQTGQLVAHGAQLGA